MTPTADQVYQSAMTLRPDERAELADELLATLEVANDSDAARYAALRAAVDKGVASLDAGRGTVLSIDELDDYLSERSRIATVRAAAKRA